jgi:hypothetical protein
MARQRKLIRVAANLCYLRPCTGIFVPRKSNMSPLRNRSPRFNVDPLRMREHKPGANSHVVLGKRLR